MDMDIDVCRVCASFVVIRIVCAENRFSASGLTVESRVFIGNKTFEMN